MNSILHVNTQYWDWFENPDYCKSRIHDIFFVGFQERLSEDFNKLKKKLGIPEDAALPTDDTKAHRNPSNLDTRLSDEAVNNLKAWYRSDYEFIDFCCTNILNNRQPGLWLRLKTMLHR